MAIFCNCVRITWKLLQIDGYMLRGVFTARRYASTVYAVMRCLSVLPSVCLSVCLSRSWIMSKRTNISWNFFTIGQPHLSGLTKRPAISQQLCKTASRGLSAIAELLVHYIFSFFFTVLVVHPHYDHKCLNTLYSTVARCSLFVARYNIVLKVPLNTNQTCNEMTYSTRCLCCVRFCVFKAFLLLHLLNRLLNQSFAN